MPVWFTPTPFQNVRLKTHNVTVGSIQMGYQHPIRVQSMANTSTYKVEASVNQAIEIIDAGGELVRYTVINSKDAEALKEIKALLVEKGYNTPIVADVHFNPDLADIAAQYVDKVRINPGNYIDKRATFTTIDYNDKEYAIELDALESRFNKFLDLCVKHNTAIRVGTNHGSLSDRIMSRYGDTPEGMVEATMEFLRICEKRSFTNVVVSLKSSNTRVMVGAYRLLALHMHKENMRFALHLGVTEAGCGEDGRIKSAVGIGTLLHDGLGDTIRVSLTEHPAKEIPVAKTLVNHFKQFEIDSSNSNSTIAFNPYCYNKRVTIPHLEKALVVADISTENEILEETFTDIDFIFDEKKGLFKPTDLAPDAIFVGEHIVPFQFTKDTKLIIDCKYWENRPNTFPLFSFDEYLMVKNKSNIQNWVQITTNQLTPEFLEVIKNDPTAVLVCFSFQTNYTQDIRLLMNKLIENDIQNPIIIQQSYTEINHENFQLKSAADMGLFFIDGLADGLWLKNTFKANQKQLVETSFAILQASRTRVTKTEYISCPGCGRTLFELEKSLAEIKQATQHLKGLKIAIMGCIVNGPGEMADADYGYVGAGPGKISLYKGKKLVKPNIDTKDAVKELLYLIDFEQKL
ncbi:MAG: (E)-4-hydroxy-3-methylbut-2-enyl-diphosphate synthase [Salinivirgaceae bacterium]|jgi:(E)-4-hydroxy-3-methylbut-2-enyl-diphosphate synthase|nr:(E)-4-hydroxy-3-methylbut-2-enyl-diphosphate synthase [Salinivirgaceae bacterium]